MSLKKILQLIFSCLELVKYIKTNEILKTMYSIRTISEIIYACITGKISVPHQTCPKTGIN